METAQRYSRLAAWWQEQQQHSSYGISALLRALRILGRRGRALDLGCGSSGRFIDKLLEEGFAVEGMDLSSGMLALARQRHPEIPFHQGEISSWTFPRSYDLITAWDSSFHLPLERQEPALRNMCGALRPGGVLLFTCGAGAPGEVAGGMEGERFEYSTLGPSRFCELLEECGCPALYLNRDQGEGELHMVIIARKER